MFILKHRLYWLVLNLMFVASLLAWMPANNSPAAADIPPYILSTSPAAGAYNIPIGDNITIRFSEKILPGPMATYNSISVLDAGGNPVAFVKNISGSKLVIDPVEFLSTGTYYKVTIPAGALKDTSGNRTRANYSFGFATNRPEGDNTSMTNTTTMTDTTTHVTSTTTMTDTPISVTSITTIEDTTTPVTDVSCDVLGMIPDDKTKGLYNYNKLIAEVKKGAKINVNGTYYLRSPYSECSSENQVDAGLFLTGDSPAHSKLILMGGSFFNIKGSALIEKISIECPTDRLSYLIRMNAPFVNEITVRNNYITGNIRLIDSDIPFDVDFISTPCDIEKLVIENNEIYDVYNSSGNRTIILVTNTPVKSSYIRNNKVTNFSYIFYNNGITNGHPSEKYLTNNSNAVIENNKIICTDDYDAVNRNNGNISGYYCFALIEGFRVECRNNIFEGFHVSEAPDTVVYDNYFSITKLLYEGNTWKNIVNFTPSISHVDIMKSKSGTSVAGEKTERIYRNNTYIVEPGYADRFGQDRFLLRKKINTWQTDIDSIIIEDNYFDMYILSFDYYGQRFKELYKFNRNTVLMDTIEHSVHYQAFAIINEMRDESGNFIPRDLIFTNNTITCDTAPFGAGIGNRKFYLIHNTAGYGDKTTVDFSNNYIDVPGLELSPSDIAAGINFNNTIKSTAMQSEGVSP